MVMGAGPIWVSRLTNAVADFVGSATLVAVIATVEFELIVAGAVYRPLVLNVPTDGLMDHVTATLPLHATNAENCCVWDVVNVTLPGVMDTLTGGFSSTVPDADLVGSATLVAVNVIVCCAGMLLGAVYRPVDEIVPTDGLIVQITAVLEVFCTCAENWLVWFTVSTKWLV